MRRSAPARLVTLASVFVAVGAIMALTAGAASAHKAKTIKQHFTIQYASAYITTEGEVFCKGVHETNAELFPGNETEGGRDKEKCASTVHKKFTAITGGETGNMFPGSPSYESDWFYLKGESGETIASTKVLWKVGANDKKFTLLVYVPLEGKYPALAESL